MKKKNDPAISMGKEELQKLLKKKTSALEKLVRESEIEAALEKVRSRTMAMQRSEELQDAALLLFQQLRALSVPLIASGFNIWDDDRKAATAWMAIEDIISPPFKISSAEDAFVAVHAAAQSGESLFVLELSGMGLETHLRYLRTIPVFKTITEKIFDAGHPFPAFQVIHCAFFSQGYLTFITYERVPKAHDTFKRFAKVFEQTYTRFLDLKKSEDQARESQIQLALERVRARTMAMQRSDELADVALALFQQVKELGIHAWVAGFNIWQPDNTSYIDWVTGPTGEFLEPYTVDLTSHPVFKTIMEVRLRGDDFFISELEGQQLKETYELLSSFGDKGQFQKILDSGIQFPTRQINHFVFGAHVSLLFITYEPCPEGWDIFKRFGKVFEQTYTRFLDLEKAESQAREAQVEATLERVRSRTMAMQRSEELTEVASIMFQQVNAFGVSQWTCGFGIWELGDKEFTWYSANADGNISPWKIPLTEHPVFIEFDKSRRRGEEFYFYEKKGEFQAEHYQYMLHLPGNDYFKSLWDSGFVFPDFQIDHVVNFSHGNLVFITYEQVPEMHDIFKRFGKVFEQTYTRFLDLQKVEAQAREAQIEAALERVRSRSMGMQKSDELKEVIQVVFEQFVHLNIKIEHTGFVMDYKARDDYNIWVADPRGVPSEITIPYFDSVYYNRFNEAKEKGEDFFATNLGFEEKNRFYQTLFKYIPGLPEEARDFYFSCPGLAVSTVLLEDVALYIENFSGAPYSDQENATLMRFGKVFQQTYTRFLDLQKVEEQARESQIEAALERVRSRSMGMQKSEELREVVQVIYEQFIHLGFKIDGAGFNVDIRDSDDWNLWMAHRFTGVPTKLHIPYFDHPLPNSLLKARNNGDQTLILSLTREEKNRLLDHAFKYVIASEDEKNGLYSTEGYLISEVLFKDVALFIENYTGIPYTDAENAVLMRFGKAFEQSYIRFNDLKHAEAQTREARIEAALERARTQSMLMQHSDELSETLQVFHHQVELLGINSNFSFLWLPDEENDKHVFWATWAEEYNGSTMLKSKTLTYPLDRNEHYTAECLADWKGGEPVHTYKVPPAEVNNYFAAWQELLSGAEKLKPDFFPDGLDYVEAYMKYGCFGVVISRLLTEEEKEILRRFSVEFERAYTRFLDLQKAEAQALEAIKRASVDRVRAEIASMRTTNDLERITPLIWNELTILGVPFIRCGVFIMDEEHEQVHTFLSTPEGKAILSFTSAYSNQKVITEALPYWRRKEIYKAHWDEAAFLEQAKNLVEQGAISSSNTYLTENRPQNLYLHFLPFLQGILYVGNVEPLNGDHLQLVQALAEAFSTAYARYEDFNKLESANLKIEKTLVDLKQTQAQLVQSEKMASLGELTAGIAHEIQNPLNFVNNFSEVNRELLAELNDEIEKGNYAEVKTIAKDLISNEEKISHHGKRADAIVKGMLQHSRSTSVTKEPTDINKLADEYLRLAYHGLRAKDKLFNATMKCDYEESIGAINIFPQDIGRVLLNLYNNAFYAVTQKKKQDGELYQPMVQVTTQKLNGKVEITVKDNGNGIPQKVKDKIFQPFFTTKPTGQGTGLGLSLAYDIVKAHGGEIRVDTNEGEFTKFIIQLPA